MCSSDLATLKEMLPEGTVGRVGIEHLLGHYMQLDINRVKEISEKLRAKGIQEQEANHIPKNKSKAVIILPEVEYARKAMESFSSKAKKVASIFLDEKNPIDFVKEAGDKNSLALLKLRDILKNINEQPEEVTLGGVKMKLSQTSDDILTLEIGRASCRERV